MDGQSGLGYQNFGRYVLGCIEADFWNSRLILRDHLRSARLLRLRTAPNSIILGFVLFRKFSVNSLTAVKHLHIFFAANLRMPSLSIQDLFSERYATLTSDFAHIHDWAGYDPALGSFLSLSRPLPPSCVGPQTTASSLQLVK